MTYGHGVEMNASIIQTGESPYVAREICRLVYDIVVGAKDLCSRSTKPVTMFS